MKPTVKYLAIGTLAGAANGLFGSGGGLFLVPLLTSWTRMKPKHAFATSIAVIVPLSVVSFIVFWVRGSLNLAFAWPYLVGGALGGIASGLFFKRLSVTALRRLFGILLLYGGVRAVLLL